MVRRVVLPLPFDILFQTLSGFVGNLRLPVCARRLHSARSRSQRSCSQGSNTKTSTPFRLNETLRPAALGLAASAEIRTLLKGFDVPTLSATQRAPPQQGGASPYREVVVVVLDATAAGPPGNPVIGTATAPGTASGVRPLLLPLPLLRRRFSLVAAPSASGVGAGRALGLGPGFLSAVGLSADVGLSFMRALYSLHLTNCRPVGAPCDLPHSSGVLLQRPS